MAQLSDGSRFLRRQFPYGGAGFKPAGYVSIVVS